MGMDGAWRRMMSSIGGEEGELFGNRPSEYVFNLNRVRGEFGASANHILGPRRSYYLSRVCDPDP